MTRTLILMRHAEGNTDAPFDDHDRPLSDVGRRAAIALRKWMQASEISPDEVLVSTAERALETLARLKIESAKVRKRDTLYQAEPEKMMNELRGAKGECVLMIGHNPGLAEFAGKLVVESPPHPRFDDCPTGGTLVAEFECETWKEVEWDTAEAKEFVTPRELPGMSDGVIQLPTGP